jgi:hypothetical protein
LAPRKSKLACTPPGPSTASHDQERYSAWSRHEPQRPEPVLRESARVDSLAIGAPTRRVLSRDREKAAAPTPLRLALDDEGLAADLELIVRARIGDLARPHLEGRGLGMNAGLAEADDRIWSPGDDPHRHRLAAGGRVDRIDPERGERRVHRVPEHRHQVRLPLISTRGRVQIGSSREPNLLPEGEVDALALEQLVLNTSSDADPGGLHLTGPPRGCCGQAYRRAPHIGGVAPSSPTTTASTVRLPPASSRTTRKALLPGSSTERSLAFSIFTTDRSSGT